MAYFKLNELDPRYQKSMGVRDLRGFAVYTEQQERVGTIIDLLVDQSGRFQYFIVDLLPVATPKQILLDLNQAQVDFDRRLVSLPRLSRTEVLSLPRYTDQDFSAVPTAASPATPALATPVETSHSLSATAPVEWSAPLEASAALESHQELPQIQQSPQHAVQPSRSPAPPVPATPVQRGTVVEQELIPLLEERLAVQTRRRKVGEVIVRKEIETKMIQVPVRRERLIVEQIAPERKPLAVVDLAEDDTNDDTIELFPVNRSHGSTLNASFPSAQVASEFLEAIAASLPNSSAPVQVTITVADPALKPTYEQVAHRYHSSPTTEKLP